MAQETERKFLVISNDFKKGNISSARIVQGYLSSVPERTVRIRIKGDKGYITIKGIGNQSGVTRYEWEKEITHEEAKELLQLCEPGVIDKVRHAIRYKKHLFEVDEFFGDNRGLVLAEIELGDEHEFFDKPTWLGREVTGDQKYYNSMLMKKPYSKW